LSTQDLTTCDSHASWPLNAFSHRIKMKQETSLDTERHKHLLIVAVCPC